MIVLVTKYRLELILFKEIEEEKKKGVKGEKKEREKERTKV